MHGAVSHGLLLVPFQQLKSAAHVLDSRDICTDTPVNWDPRTRKPVSFIQSMAGRL